MDTAMMTYDGEWTTITDPTGKQRKQRVDMFGRLVEVIEDPIRQNYNGLNYVTTYAYDTLNNLTHVIQGNQTRTFSYSTLSRLRSANNPESGITSYTYYDSGDLATKTDARGATSTITYDALRRIATKTYSDATPTVMYTYHMTSNGSTAPNIGQLKSVSSSVATTTYSYNNLGQVLTSSQAVAGTGTKTFAYEWYLNGALKKQTYPSGKVVNYSVDNAGRTDKVYTSTTAYADLTVGTVGANAYTADGRATKMKLGNGLFETRNFTTPGTPTVYMLGTTNGGNNRVEIKYNFSGTMNNGNVISQEITRNGTGTTWVQSYDYDGVNRLSYASEAGGWHRTYGYDMYGNRYITAPKSGPVFSNPLEPTSLSDYVAALNQFTTVPGFREYDAAGNQTNFVGVMLEYDAEGRNTSMNAGGDTITFYYDGEGRRVKKVYGGVTTYYIYNALGQLAVEYSTDTQTAGTSYLFTDMLGSVRTITNSAGNVLECYDYLPFGQILSTADNGRNAAGCHPADPDNLAGTRADEKFTGQKRDNETGLDFFNARYFYAPLGRFMSPDPGNAGASTNDPQSWNAYAYARNNPLKYTDPEGKRYQVCWDGGECHEMYDHDYLNYKATVIDPIGYIAGKGIIYQKDVVGFVQLGTVKYLMSDEMWELMQGTQRAKPFVEAAGIGALLLTGGFAALDWVAAGGFIESLGLIATASAPVTQYSSLLRQQYTDAVKGLTGKISSMQQSGFSSEQIARALHAERRALGAQFKALTPPEKLEEIYARNLNLYGDKFGPSIEWLRKTGKSWSDIINSAIRPGGKDLGF